MVQAAAETWNRESWGPSLHYSGGFVHTGTPYNDLADICDAITTKPVVLVSFVEGCRDDDNNSICDSNPYASVINLFDQGTIIPDCVAMFIWGDTNSAGECDGSNDPALPYNLGIVDHYVGTDYYSIDCIAGGDIHADTQAMLTHEFGHVLGLGHPSRTGNDAAEGRAVVANLYPDSYTSTYDCVGWPGGRHLFPWDRDCADDRSATRTVKYAWLDYDNTTHQWAAEHYTHSSWDTTKGVNSGGYLRDSSNNQHYGLFRALPSAPTVTDEIKRSIAGTNGWLNWTTTTTLSGNGSDPAGTYVAPLFFSPEEWSVGAGNNARINYAPLLRSLPIANDYTSVDQAEPLPWRYLRSDSLFTTTPTNGLYSYTCLDAGDESCSGGVQPLVSNVPLASAWDPVAGYTLFASVETRRNVGAMTTYAAKTKKVDDYGRILVYPGFSGSLQYGLYKPSTPSLSTLPSAPTGYSYRVRTESTPAIACAPSSTAISYNGDTYNCLLAWVDIGAPEGRILYTYFKVITFAGVRAIYWADQAWARSGTRTVGNISAAWFDGAFWLTWKEATYNGPIRVAKNSSSSATGWSTLSSFGVGTTIVDAPTFVSVPTTGVEAGLIWTQQ